MNKVDNNSYIELLGEGTLVMLIVVKRPNGSISIVDLQDCVWYEKDDYGYIIFRDDDNMVSNFSQFELDEAITAARKASEILNMPYETFESRYCSFKESDYLSETIIDLREEK